MTHDEVSVKATSPQIILCDTHTVGKNVQTSGLETHSGSARDPHPHTAGIRQDELLDFDAHPADGKIL